MGSALSMGGIVNALYICGTEGIGAVLMDIAVCWTERDSIGLCMAKSRLENDGGLTGLSASRTDG